MCPCKTLSSNSYKQTSWELYDMGADPTEAANLADKYPERVREMAAKYAQWEQDATEAGKEYDKRQQRTN